MVSGLHLPGQALDTPTYHPYNTAMQPRRLDYLFVKGVKPVRGGVHECPHQAASDPAAVWVTLDGGLLARPPGLASQAWPGPSQPQGEASTASKRAAMRKAAQRLAHSDPASRTAWKAVSRARKQEHRAWLQSNTHKASQADWRAKRTVDRHTAITLACKRAPCQPFSRRIWYLPRRRGSGGERPARTAQPTRPSRQ